MLLGPVMCFNERLFDEILLGGSAYTVTKESGTPTSEHAAETLGSTDRVEGLHVALVKLRVNLATALDEIQRGHCRVSEALESTISVMKVPAVNGIPGIIDTDAGEHTTKSAGGIVLGSPKLNLARFVLCLVTGNIVFSSGFLGNHIGLLLHVIDRTPSRERVASLGDRLGGFLRT